MMKALITIVVIVISGIVIGTTASAVVKPHTDQEVLSTQSKQVTQQKTIPQPGIPLTVRIPKINVNTKIESVANDKEGRMDVPKDDMNTSWYNPGYRPGQNGSAVLAGHLDKKDSSPAIFWDLKKLVKGDKIYVTDDKGKERVFAVVSSTKYPDAGFPINKVFASSSVPMLNLITCNGTWNKGSGYDQRLVVYSQLVTN